MLALHGKLSGLIVRFRQTKFSANLWVDSCGGYGTGLSSKALGVRVQGLGPRCAEAKGVRLAGCFFGVSRFRFKVHVGCGYTLIEEVRYSFVEGTAESPSPTTDLRAGRGYLHLPLPNFTINMSNNPHLRASRLIDFTAWGLDLGRSFGHIVCLYRAV